MKVNWRERWPLIVAAAIFVVTASVLVWQTQGMVNSPDEAANLTLARAMQKTNRLFVAAPAGSTAYPFFARSTAPVAGGVVPAGFVGLPLGYGILAKVLSGYAIFYLTIFFTVVGGLAWWFLVRRLFSARVANFAAVFWWAQPAVVYYAARGLFPNLLLIDLWLICAAAIWRGREEKKKINKILLFVLGVGAAGLAVAVRPPETILLAAIFLALIFWQGKKRARIFSGSAAAILLLLAAGLWWAHLQTWWPGGYKFLSTRWWEVILPFGFHPRLIWSIIWHYPLQLFWPITVVGAGGLIYWWRKNSELSAARFVISALGILSLWTLVAYGSWQFFDNPDIQAVTMGVSYVRYFLPLWLLLSLGLALAANFIYEKKKWAAGVFVILFLLFSGWRVFSGVDGYLAVRQQVRAAKQTVAAVRALLPVNAVLGVRAWDKYFWPQTAVLQPFPQEPRAVVAAADLLRHGTPVWALVRPWQEIDWRWLRDNGLRASEKKVFGDHVLYELSLWKK